MSDTTWYEMKPVGLDYLDTAPAVWVVEEDLSAPRAAVWDAFADASSWQHWFPHVDAAHYDGDPPHGVGSIRRSSVAGALHVETMLAWDDLTRWGYRVDRSTLRLSTAQIEITEFEDCAAGTRVRWTIACDPLDEFTFLAGERPMQAFLAELHADAMRRLERHLGPG